MGRRETAAKRFSYENVTDVTREYFDKHLSAQAVAFAMWDGQKTTRAGLSFDKRFDLFWSMKASKTAFATLADERRYKVDLKVASARYAEMQAFAAAEPAPTLPETADA